jgi:hypothetical protein
MDSVRIVVAVAMVVMTVVGIVVGVMFAHGSVPIR